MRLAVSPNTTFLPPFWKPPLKCEHGRSKESLKNILQLISQNGILQIPVSTATVAPNNMCIITCKSACTMLIKTCQQRGKRCHLLSSKADDRHSRRLCHAITGLILAFIKSPRLLPSASAGVTQLPMLYWQCSVPPDLLDWRVNVKYNLRSRWGPAWRSS